MARSVQITIVTSMRGRGRFVESLNGIILSILFENEGIRLTFCIIVEQQYLFISVFGYCLELGIGVSDIWHYSRYGLNPITLMLPVN